MDCHVSCTYHGKSTLQKQSRQRPPNQKWKLSQKTSQFSLLRSSVTLTQVIIATVAKRSTTMVVASRSVTFVTTSPKLGYCRAHGAYQCSQWCCGKEQKTKFLLHRISLGYVNCELFECKELCCGGWGHLCLSPFKMDFTLRTHKLIPKVKPTFQRILTEC